MNKDFREFQSFTDDKVRWVWLLENRGLVDFTIMLDNDDTMIIFEGDTPDEEYCYCMRYFLGNSKGVGDLLTVLGFCWEEC